MKKLSVILTGACTMALMMFLGGGSCGGGTQCLSNTNATTLAAYCTPTAPAVCPITTNPAGAFLCNQPATGTSATCNANAISIAACSSVVAPANCTDVAPWCTGTAGACSVGTDTLCAAAITTDDGTACNTTVSQSVTTYNCQFSAATSAGTCSPNTAAINALCNVAANNTSATCAAFSTANSNLCSWQ